MRGQYRPPTLDDEKRNIESFLEPGNGITDSRLAAAQRGRRLRETSVIHYCGQYGPLLEGSSGKRHSIIKFD